jgi:hypothetical protein
MAFSFASRSYGPDSSPEELQALRDRVFLVEPGIIYWHEIPVQGAFTLNLMEERVIALIREHGARGIVVDLSDTQAPTPEVRELLRPFVQRMIERTSRYVIFTGKNFLVNASAKFVLAALFGRGRVGLKRTREEALQDVRDALARG